jgi:hypothetical protein
MRRGEIWLYNADRMKLAKRDLVLLLIMMI